MTAETMIAGLALAVWLYLLVARGGFWRGEDHDGLVLAPAPSGAGWPAVAAVLPARNEADVVGQAVDSLLRQDYPGQLRVVLVDDQSSDGTGAAALSAAEAAGASGRLTVLAGQPLPAGWTGKLWAIKQGISHVEAAPEAPEFLLLSDADIAYAPDALRRLVARAQSGGLTLASLMAKLRCESLSERALIPAFIFFFQMLYPFRWINRPGSRTAGAAGGCMLLRRQALRAAGGIEAIRGELIDDCALGRRLKRQGPISLMLTERAVSLRRYPHVGEIRRMIARSAYAQLRFSPLLLAGTAVGMALTYLAPPLLALFGSAGARPLAGAAWLLMAFAFQPTLRFYRVSPFWGPAMPAIAAIYLWFTLDSAWQHRQGRGGLWKGRIQAPGGETR
jgi:hopene-associated glycosyltransferase HpnB